MKLFYTQEILEHSLRKIKDLYNKELINYELNTPVTGILIKINGEDSLINSFIDIDNDGLLVVLMDPFKIEEIKGYQHFKFKDMQGIKIKRGLINIVIKIQFTDGTQYVFNVLKRKLKHLPNQKDNIEKIITILQSKNLNNMKNNIYKKKRRINRFTDLLYIVTLLILELITIMVLYNSFKSIFQNQLFFIIIVLLVFGLHCALYIIFGIIIDYLRDIKFVNEYTPIINQYAQTNDANQLLSSLLNIKRFPKTQEKKNIYYLSLSTAYYKTNNRIDAKNNLLKIITNDQNMIQKMKKQLELIEE